MDPNLYSLIIGAIITLITSIVTTIIAYIIQTKHEEKLRNLKILDNQIDNKFALKKKRFIEIEDTVSRLAIISSNLISLEERFVARVIKNDGVNEIIEFLNTKPTKRKIEQFLKLKNINMEIVEARLERENSENEKFTEDNKIIENEFRFLSEKFHVFYPIANEAVFSEIDKYISLIRDEILQLKNMRHKFDNGESINVKKERKRITMFMYEVSNTHGFIINTLDRMLYTVENEII